MEGLSIANNLLANSVEYHLEQNQSMLKNTVTQLSSGLRINSAADDPSGLAISTNLQTQVDAYQQAASNVQDANNAAQVAEGALATQTQILQRIRDMAVQASSDVASQSDRENLQTEITQLIDEINRISENTNFNGQTLLDGSHAGYQPAQDAYYVVSANAVLASMGNGAAGVGITPGNLIASVNPVMSPNPYFQHTPDSTPTYTGVQGVGALGEATVDGTLMLQVINNGGAAAVQETFIESASGYVTVASTLFAANSTITANVSTSSAAGFDNLAITIGNITNADIGQTAYVKISQHVDASSFVTAQPLTIQSGANEGDTVEIGIQATNAQTLRISNINVALSSSVSPTIGAEDAIGQADIALNMLLQQRAQLGAVIVRLNEDANNDSVAAVNMQASESAIRDLNVGEATTEFTREQVLVQVGTSVLSQANANADSVLGLFR